MKTTETKAPAPRPCESCPYRLDVPSGIWEAHEYLKLPDYDLPLVQQPMKAFMCHQNDGRLCAGWVACHGGEALGLRLIAAYMEPEEVDKLMAWKTDVPVFESGNAACQHGLREIKNPGMGAAKMMGKIERRRG